MNIATKSGSQAGSGPWPYVLIALALGAIMAVMFPPYSGPDEKAHVAYIAALSRGQIPIVPIGQTSDLDSNVTYEALHPPVSYAIATPFYYIAKQHNLLTGLYVARLIGVFMLACTVWLIYHVAESIISSRSSSIAAFLVATNPVIVYVCSMVNNESGAVLKSAFCALCAVKAREKSGFSAWLVLTAIAGVIAAMYLVGSNTTKTERLLRILFVGGVSVGIGLTWILFMKSQYVTSIPSPFYKPRYIGGPQALLLFPGEALFYGFILSISYAIGLVIPQWLQQSDQMYFYLTEGCGNKCYGYVYGLFVIGALITIWLVNSAWRSNFKFLLFSYFAIYLILLDNLYFRDSDIMYFSARYTPVVGIFVAILASFRFVDFLPKAKKAFTAAWTILIVLEFAIIFQFFM